MFSKTFEVVNGDCRATVTVKTETGFAAIDRMTAEVSLGVYDADDTGKLKLSGREWTRRKQFATAWSQSEIVDGNLGFEWCDAPFDSDAMMACYEAWGALPGPVVMTWLNAVNMVDIPPNDPELLPRDKVEKKSAVTPE